MDSVPEYVLAHAPLVHLHTKDPYRPSSLSAQLDHTHPEIDLKPLPNDTHPALTLANLSVLNTLGGKNVYLTSNEDITTGPKWLEGITSGDTNDLLPSTEISSVVVLVEKEGDILDAFYFLFYAYNYGGIVLSHQLGNHVGDWEHIMIRFRSSLPQAVWFSQHANGAAYTFSCLQKDSEGKRPVVYAANGTHAMYPTSGTHDHTIPNLDLSVPLLLVDEADEGPMWDVTRNAWYYAYSAGDKDADGGFKALSPTAEAPTSFLEFVGQWGDQEYPADDPRQKGKELFSFKRYTSGPTGPVDKQLTRKEVWPENQFSKGQKVRTRLGLSLWGRIKKRVRSWRQKGKVTKVKASGEIVR